MDMFELALKILNSSSDPKAPKAPPRAIDIDSFDIDRHAKALMYKARKKIANEHAVQSLDALTEIAHSLFPIEEIRNLPIPKAEQTELLKSLLGNPMTLTESRSIAQAYINIQEKGGHIPADKLAKLEVVFAQDMANFLATPAAAAPITRESTLDALEALAKKVGLNVEHIGAMAVDGNILVAEMKTAFPKMGALVEAGVAAEAAKEAQLAAFRASYAASPTTATTTAEARIVEEASTHARPFGEIVSEMSRRTKKAYGSAHTIETEALDLTHEIARAVIPFDEIAKLPAETKFAIETRINEGFFKNPVLTMFEACKAAKDAGIPIEAERVRKLEALMAHDLVAYIKDEGLQNVPQVKSSILRNVHNDNKDVFRALGVRPTNIFHCADNPELLATQMSNISPDAINWINKSNGVAAQEKAATMAAEAAEAEAFARIRAAQAQPTVPTPTSEPTHTPASSTPHASGSSSYSSGGHSSSPSTTVSSVESKGREWYKFFTHELKDSKAVFSGKRAAISGGVAALVAGGAYMLNRNKDDSWQNRTSDRSEAEATR